MMTKRFFETNTINNKSNELSLKSRTLPNLRVYENSQFQNYERILCEEGW